MPRSSRSAPRATAGAPPSYRWRRFDEGVVEIGHDGKDFAFDNSEFNDLLLALVSGGGSALLAAKGTANLSAIAGPGLYFFTAYCLVSNAAFQLLHRQPHPAPCRLRAPRPPCDGLSPGWRAARPTTTSSRRSSLRSSGGTYR